MTANIFETVFAYAFGIIGGVALAFIAVAFLICMAAYVMREIF